MSSGHSSAKRGRPTSTGQGDPPPTEGPGERWGCLSIDRGSREQGRDIRMAVNVIRPSVQLQHGWPITGADFVIADIENTGLDLLDRRERRQSLGLPGVRERRSQ